MVAITLQEPMPAKDVFIPTTKPNYNMICVVVFYTASSAALLQLLQRDLLRLSHQGLTYEC